MRHLRLFLLGILLLAYLGCGKTEDKTEPAKTPTETADRTGESKSNTGASGTGATASAKGFEMIPKGTVLLASVRPSAAMSSPFFKSLPNQDEIAQAMSEMTQNVGFDATNIARVSVALWPGDGNVFPGLMNAARPMQPQPGAIQPETIQREAFPAPKLDEVDCGPQPGDGFQPPPEAMPNMMVQMFQNLIPKVDGAVFVEFNNPVDLNQLVQKIPENERPQAVTAEGLSLQVFPDAPVGGGVAAWQPNPKMVVMTFRNDVADITKNTGTNELATQAAAEGANATASVQLSLAPLQKLLEMGASMAQGQVEGGENLAKQLKSLSLFVGLNDGADVSLLIDTTDPSAVKTIKDAIDQQYQGLEGQVQMVSQDLPPGTDEDVKDSAQAVAQEIYDSVKSEAKGNQYRLSLRVPPEATEVFVKVAKEQANITRDMNSLKNIVLACLGFHEAYGEFPFPAGLADAPEDQRNKLSWRVHLLPMLDHANLYRQFKLNEPWDSPHNKALIDKMPDWYKLSNETKPGHTQIVAPAGKGFVVDGDNVRRIQDFTDGTSNTIVALTLAPEKAEIWTKPGGFELDPAKAAEVLGGHPAGFMALFADGSVHVLPGSIEPDMLKALLTIAGGEPVSPYDLEQ